MLTDTECLECSSELHSLLKEKKEEENSSLIALSSAGQRAQPHPLLDGI